MEPLLLVCGGCGVKIRAADPERARTRDCPRCATPLASAVAEALRVDTSDPAPVAAEPISTANPSSKRRTLSMVTALALVGAALAINLSLVPSDVHFGSANTDSRSPRSSTDAAVRAVSWASVADPHPQNQADGSLATDPDASLEPDADLATKKPDPPELAVGEPPSNLAIRDSEPPSFSPLSEPSPGVSSTVKPIRPATSVPPDPRPADSPERVPAPPVAPSTPAPAPSEPRRLLVRDAKGKAVVAREHGTIKDQMAVVLPDGTIGWPTTQVFTDDPFVPSTIDEMERTLKGEFADFRVVKTEHYLVFYQSSERFARDSADLLEKLLKELTRVLKEQKLSSTPSEFPLVAVIFRTEDDFRTSRRVAPEVQAYYEILSNRIFFFESGRETASPEVAALRKPQTVAHEGTHQILHNVGIQPRMSPWPLWLVEGLAEYCSPPKPTKRGVDWAGLGQINPIHLTTIRDLDDPMSSEVRGGPKVPTARDRGQPLVKYLATRSELTPTDYALSWGLTHYLAQKQVDKFVAYIRKLNRLRPFETRTPEEQLADFREAFGPDLNKLDAQVAKHLSKLMKLPESQALPFYAVLLEQRVSPNAVRRMSMVSQSPSLIRQWVETASNQGDGQVHWEPIAHPNRTRAVMTADSWVHQGR